MTTINATKTQDGRWWEDRWWVEHAGEYHLPGTPEEISAAVDTLVPHFGGTWATELLASGRAHTHPIGKRLLYERGLYTAGLILDLARQIQLFSASPGFAGKLNKLRGTDPEEALSVIFEIGVAQVFAGEGAHIRFPPEGRDKTPDITAEFGDERLSVECKRLQEEIWEDWSSTLMRNIVFGLPVAHGQTDLAFDITLHPRLSDIIRGEWNKNGMAEALSVVLTRRIHDEIQQRLAMQGIPFRCTIPDVCEIIAKDKSQGQGGVSGMELSSPAIFRRILSNGFERAALQLPTGHAGLVVVHSNHLPEYSFAQLVFDTLMENRGSEYSHVAGMIIFTQQYMLAERRAPYFLFNRHCRYSDSATRAAKIVRRKISPVEQIDTGQSGKLPSN